MGIKYNIVSAVLGANAGWWAHATRSAWQLSTIVRYKGVAWWRRLQQRSRAEPMLQDWRHARNNWPRGVDSALEAHAPRDWSEAVWDRSR